VRPSSSRANDPCELAVHVRERPELNGMKLVALTGYGQESDRQKSREAGFDQHLVRPVDFTAVESVLAECNRAGDSESIE
jgi:CheY-like chemotaxis protein